MLFHYHHLPAPTDLHPGLENTFNIEHSSNRTRHHIMSGTTTSSSRVTHFLDNSWTPIHSMVVKIYTIVYTPRDVLRTRAQHLSIPRVIELMSTDLRIFLCWVPIDRSELWSNFCVQAVIGRAALNLATDLPRIFWSLRAVPSHLPANVCATQRGRTCGNVCHFCDPGLKALRDSTRRLVCKALFHLESHVWYMRTPHCVVYAPTACQVP
ncbi:hypothetical protein BJV74DRAFT_157593 [Russula compacta]|nr:hypothetical protein BJV74DRAFT_157593 [Russula compacta]